MFSREFSLAKISQKNRRKVKNILWSETTLWRSPRERETRASQEFSHSHMETKKGRCKTGKTWPQRLCSRRGFEASICIKRKREKDEKFRRTVSASLHEKGASGGR